MKSVLHKISSLFLALLLVFSTTSFTVEKHFCGDFLIDVSFLGNADSCKGETKKNCDGQAVVVKKKCCKDELAHIKGQDDIKKTTDEKITFQQQKFILAFNISFKLLFGSLEKQFIPHKNYSPPKIIQDIQVLNEVFII
ncbi:HYC_CC_PP family protein [Tenacibaculum sp. nBUS_03]|uniref:HYC_CC_PP family protein n=1 Tax=Tenacibaculum sp. nBUS_03 TaxID=3395320 RepID=UPI003EBFACE1